MDGVVPEPVIQTFWHRGRLSRLEQLSIRSFQAHGHPVHLYSYEPLEGVPEGVVPFDAATVLPWDPAYEGSKAGISGFANAFRYELLSRGGGWWCDLDVVALAPFPTPKHCLFASEATAQAHNDPTNCVMYLPSGDPLGPILRDRSMAKHPATLRWCETGPGLIKKVVQEFHLQDRLAKSNVFCPLYYENWAYAFLPGQQPAIETGTTLAIHFMNTLFRIKDMDKDADYAPGSLYETLKRRYGVL